MELRSRRGEKLQNETTAATQVMKPLSSGGQGWVYLLTFVANFTSAVYQCAVLVCMKRARSARLYLLLLCDVIMTSRVSTHWIAASWKCTPWGQWCPWMRAAVGWWSFVKGGSAARMPSGWSCHLQPGPLQLEPAPPELELQELDSRPEHALWAGQRSWGGGGLAAEVETAAGGGGCWMCLKAWLMEEQMNRRGENNSSS